MKLTTDINAKIKLEQALIKADKLCKVYKCNLIELMVLSMQVNAQNKIAYKIKIKNKR